MKITIPSQNLDLTSEEMKNLHRLGIKFTTDFFDIIGKKYIPSDNSYCIDLETKKQACIAFGCCISEPKNAEFKIVSPAYEQEIVTLFGRITRKTFVNVISSTSLKVYRILYDPSNVY